MVWYGMVWYGMVWYGMVWYGMVWYGMVWYDMVWYGAVWYGMVWYGVKRVKKWGKRVPKNFFLKKNLFTALSCGVGRFGELWSRPF